MTREVFILGTFHKLQCGAAECGVDNIALLEKEIRRILSEYGIGRIAEEMSDDGLREIAGDQAPRTVCQRIAENDLVVHHFVDLGVKERACLSLSREDIDAFMFKHSEHSSEMTTLRDALTALCDEVREPRHAPLGDVAHRPRRPPRARRRDRLWPRTARAAVRVSAPGAVHPPAPAPG